MTVVDFSYARPTVAQLKGWGVTCCMRYVGQSTAKNMTPGETAAYAAAGIRTGTVFEYGAKQATQGAAQGTVDAKLGLAQATACGMPPWRPIYFAVDFDIPDYAPKSADPLAKLGPAGAYFAAAAAVLGAGRVGGYGGYWLISRLFGAKLITWGWQTRAWSAKPASMTTLPPNAVVVDGFLWDTRANLRQTGGTIDGGQLDLNALIRTHDHAGDFGAWFPGEKQPTGAHVKDLGGHSAGSIASARWDATGSDIVLDIRPDGTLWKTRWARDIHGWHTWRQVVDGSGKPIAGLCGVPSVVAWGDGTGRLRVTRKADGHILQYVTDDSGGSWH